VDSPTKKAMKTRAENWKRLIGLIAGDRLSSRSGKFQVREYIALVGAREPSCSGRNQDSVCRLHKFPARLKVRFRERRLTAQPF